MGYSGGLLGESSGPFLQGMIGIGNLFNGILMKNPASNQLGSNLMGYSSPDDVPEWRTDLGQTGSYMNTVPIGGLYRIGQMGQSAGYSGGPGGGSFGNAGAGAGGLSGAYGFGGGAGGGFGM